MEPKHFITLSVPFAERRFISMKDMYNAIEVAKYIITLCTEEECPISNLQLQKILYFLQFRFLTNGEQLFFNDICAWQFGPVVPDVYKVYSGYGGSNIISRYDTNIDEATKNKMDSEIRQLRVKKPWDLVNIAHAPNGAWDKTFLGGTGNRRKIENDLIKEDHIFI